jgi:hypothetical protein
VFTEAIDVNLAMNEVNGYILSTMMVFKATPKNNGPASQLGGGEVSPFTLVSGHPNIVLRPAHLIFHQLGKPS